MNLGSKGMSGRLLQYLTRQTTPDLGTQQLRTAPLPPRRPPPRPWAQQRGAHRSGSVRWELGLKGERGNVLARRADRCQAL